MIEKQYIILLHGLSLTSHSMYAIQKHLSKLGYDVINIDYPSRKQTIDQLSDYLASKISQLAAYKINFITHSMGGILARRYLQKYPHDNLSRILFLAPPNKGSELTEHFENNFFYKWYLGPAWLELKSAQYSYVNMMASPTYDYGIIAGNQPIEQYYSKKLPLPNDGIISVQSTRLDNVKHHITLPCNHINILWRKQVLDQISFFIEHGSFN